MLSKLFKITYKQSIATGEWIDQETWRHLKWNEPTEHNEYFTAPFKELALAHFNYWKQYRSGKDNPMEIVVIEELGPVIILQVM